MATAYEAVIGLEVHAQLQTASKLLCSCSTKFGAEPNENVCEGCAGLPGSLPRLNEKAVELAAKAGFALNCTVNEYSIFSRKSYFYPDLPDGYQNSQFTPPICVHGYLDVTVNDRTRRIGITRIHLEDDAGKCVHGQAGVTLVDLNRAGMPLIEIVSEPDMRSAEEAAAYMRHIHTVLVYLGVTDGNMEEGSLRCDANVSIRPKGSETFGTRVEIKNLNSFRHVRQAVDYEIERQKACLEDGEPLRQETRLFDAARQITQAMRSKEDAHDYRYFPNPDLPPVIVTPEQAAAWRAEMPELPHARAARFVKDYALSGEEAGIMTQDAYCYRIRKYIGAYAFAMGGLDAIVFAAGVGENDDAVRAKATQGLENFGIKMDHARNNGNRNECDLSTADSKVKIFLINTNEELAIARDTYKLCK